MAAIPQNLGVPTGTVMWSAAPEVPVGWLLCDGRFVTPGNYPALYASIGNTYGGDSNTFQLPDLVGRFIIGADPGEQDPFTYRDGENKAHKHGMFPETVHTHDVDDPGHEHPTSSGSHTHPTTSTHDHNMVSEHSHPTEWYSTGVLLATTCSQSIYASPFRGSSACERNPEDDDVRFNDAKTGITMVGTNVTGTTVEIAYTGVTLALQLTGISLEFSETNMRVDDTGVVGGPQPKNVSLLPIIRT